MNIDLILTLETLSIHYVPTVREMELNKYLFLHCHCYTNIYKTLLNTVEIIVSSVLNIIDDNLVGKFFIWKL